MKLHTLSLTAFGPFPGTETIDFDALSEDGLFLLHGRTGSGKTFILDAVTFALYGQVAGERGVTRLRSDHAAPGAVPQVILEFTLNGRRYRITRSPQHMRPKQRGSGFIQENQKAHLEVRDAGSWAPAASGSQAVGKELGEILPLDRHQFTKVILLPQGDFAEFLHSSSNEKQQLLERLFDTTTFRQLEDLLREEAKDAKAQVEEIDRSIITQRTMVLDAAERLTGVSFAEVPPEEAGEEPSRETSEPDGGLRRRITAETGTQRQSLVEQKAKAEAARTEKQQQAEELGARRRELIRYLAHRQEQQDHEAQSGTIAAQRDSLEQHGEADQLRQWFQAAGSARGTAEEHRAEVLRAAQTTQSILDSQQDIAARNLITQEPLAAEGPVDRDALRGARRELTELQGQLRAQDAQKLENEQHSLKQRAQELAETIRRHRIATEALDTQRAELKEQIAAEEAQRRDPEELEVQRDAALAAQDGLRLQRESLRKLTAEQKEQEAARHDLKEKEALAEQAAAEHEDRLGRHLRGIAAELSGDLNPGEPCRVCGSLDHPRPAEPDENTVTRAEVRSALARSESAAAARSTAAAKIEEASARISALEEELGETASLGEEAVQQRLDAVQAEVAECDAARQRQRELQRRLDGARTTFGETERKHAEVEAALQLAEAEEERAEEDQTRIEASLEQLRGTHASVRERVASLDELDVALTRVEETLGAAERSAHQADSAEEEALQKLRESRFGDQESLQSALLDPEELQARRQLVQSWDRTADRLAAEAGLEEVSAGRRRAEAGQKAPEETSVREAQEQAETAVQQHHEAARALDRFDDRLEQMQQSMTALEDRVAAREEQLAEQVLRSELADTLNGRGPDNRLGMTLTTFVLAARLERVAEAATRHLQIMSEGRYRLLHDDTKRGGGLQGLELKVTDQHSDEERPTSSLSGGETFMASLAMALGLAEVVQADAGGIGLESLFIDEGFGSLDEETLEHVMAALSRLQGEGRRVGVVSHVTEMHKAIPVQLRVIKSPSGSRTQMHLAGRAA